MRIWKNGKTTRERLCQIYQTAGDNGRTNSLGISSHANLSTKYLTPYNGGVSCNPIITPVRTPLVFFVVEGSGPFKKNAGYCRSPPCFHEGRLPNNDSLESRFGGEPSSQCVLKLQTKRSSKECINAKNMEGTYKPLPPPAGREKSTFLQ